jgi:hypothetical protein
MKGSINGRIKLKLVPTQDVVMKHGVRMWTGFIWLRMGTGGGLL